MPDPDIDGRKHRMRLEMRARLAALDPEARQTASARICERLRDAGTFRGARCILGFVPLLTEPDILPALNGARAAGCRVALPRWDAGKGEYTAAEQAGETGLVPGPYGILQPPPDAPEVDWERLDLILVPGLAFDASGCRLGRGRGYYDRLLARALRAQRWGVAFDVQVVPEVPKHPHDVNLDVFVTPSFLHAAGPAAPH